MAKRNISYIKPEDPKFLRLLKQQVGYDDSNPKFDQLENEPEDFVDDADSERPQVVVLKPGDLTAEQAAAEEDRIQKEEAEAKADLTQRVIFNSSKKKSIGNARKRTSDSGDKDKDVAKKPKQKPRPVLSFDVGSDEEGEDSQ